MSLEWLLIRGSGLDAYGLLAAATVWGLLISTRLLGGIAKAKPVTWFHESLALGALVATLIHMFALATHDFIEFSWLDILVPGAATWKPMAVSLGVVSFYGLFVISASFYLKRFIGQRAWRAIHFLSFGLFVSVLAHGVVAGTDSSHPVVVALYASSGAAVVLLMLIRIAQGQSSQARPTPAARRSLVQDSARQTTSR